MRVDRLVGHLAPFAVGALCACSSVKVTPSSDVRYEPKPKGCGLEFLEKAPARPYVEIAELAEHVKAPPPGGAAEALHDKACELGADALIVTRHTVTNAYGHVFVAGKAIKYVERAQPTEEEQQPEGEKAPGSVNL